MFNTALQTILEGIRTCRALNMQIHISYCIRSISTVHRLYIAIDLLHIMYQNSENKKNTQEIFLQWAQITKYCVTT